MISDDDDDDDDGETGAEISGIVSILYRCLWWWQWPLPLPDVEHWIDDGCGKPTVKSMS